MFHRTPFAALAALAGLLSLSAPGQTANDFEVGAGYLSTGVRELVEKHGWSLVWKATEDRVVDFPFTVDVPSGTQEDALQGALSNLLEAYQGQFVADMYRNNRVVVIETAPANVQLVRTIEFSLAAPDEGATESGEGQEDSTE